MQWAVHMIGKHPAVQSKLQNEVDKFYGENVIQVQTQSHNNFTLIENSKKCRWQVKEKSVPRLKIDDSCMNYLFTIP